MSRKSTQTLFRAHIALPHDHGSWVFLLSPLLIGLFVGGNWNAAAGYLLLGAFAAFLIRQPISIIVKAYSGRRSKKDLPAAIFWTAVYGVFSLISLVGLAQHGYLHLIWLAVPGIGVLGWHLYLVSKRSERYQSALDIFASGSLALAAPAGYWVASGLSDSTGWWLWLLAWLQSGSSINYAFLRLGQRKLAEVPAKRDLFQTGKMTLAFTSANLLFSLFSSVLGYIPNFVWIAFSLQWIESIWGVFNPAIGVKPTRIGLRQLAVSVLFTIVFILIWN